MFAPQFGRIETRARGRAGRGVLYEYVGARDHAVEQRLVPILLDVERDRLLAAIEPDEIARKPQPGAIVEAGEIAFRPLDFDHPCPGIGQPAGTQRRRDRLFQRHHQQSA